MSDNYPICQICGQLHDSTEAELSTCQLCGVTVHFSCYNSCIAPSYPWLCDACHYLQNIRNEMDPYLINVIIKQTATKPPYMISALHKKVPKELTEKNIVLTPMFVPLPTCICCQTTSSSVINIADLLPTQPPSPSRDEARNKSKQAATQPATQPPKPKIPPIATNSSYISPYSSAMDTALQSTQFFNSPLVSPEFEQNQLALLFRTVESSSNDQLRTAFGLLPNTIEQYRATGNVSLIGTRFSNFLLLQNTLLSFFTTSTFLRLVGDTFTPSLDSSLEVVFANQLASIHQKYLIARLVVQLLQLLHYLHKYLPAAFDLLHLHPLSFTPLPEVMAALPDTQEPIVQAISQPSMSFSELLCLPPIPTHIAQEYQPSQIKDIMRALANLPKSIESANKNLTPQQQPIPTFFLPFLRGLVDTATVYLGFFSIDAVPTTDFTRLQQATLPFFNHTLRHCHDHTQLLLQNAASSTTPLHVPSTSTSFSTLPAATLHSALTPTPYTAKQLVFPSPSNISPVAIVLSNTHLANAFYPLITPLSTLGPILQAHIAPKPPVPTTLPMCQVGFNAPNAAAAMPLVNKSSSLDKQLSQQSSRNMYAPLASPAVSRPPSKWGRQVGALTPILLCYDDVDRFVSMMIHLYPEQHAKIIVILQDMFQNAFPYQSHSRNSDINNSHLLSSNDSSAPVFPSTFREKPMLSPEQIEYCNSQAHTCFRLLIIKQFLSRPFWIHVSCRRRFLELICRQSHLIHREPTERLAVHYSAAYFHRNAACFNLSFPHMRSFFLSSFILRPLTEKCFICYRSAPDNTCSHPDCSRACHTACALALRLVQTESTPVHPTAPVVFCPEHMTGSTAYRTPPNRLAYWYNRSTAPPIALYSDNKVTATLQRLCVSPDNSALTLQNTLLAFTMHSFHDSLQHLQFDSSLLPQLPAARQQPPQSPAPFLTYDQLSPFQFDSFPVPCLDSVIALLQHQLRLSSTSSFSRTFYNALATYSPCFQFSPQIQQGDAIVASSFPGWRYSNTIDHYISINNSGIFPQTTSSIIASSDAKHTASLLQPSATVKFTFSSPSPASPPIRPLTLSYTPMIHTGDVGYFPDEQIQIFNGVISSTIRPAPFHPFSPLQLLSRILRGQVTSYFDSSLIHPLPSLPWTPPQPVLVPIAAANAPAPAPILATAPISQIAMKAPISSQAVLPIINAKSATQSSSNSLVLTFEIPAFLSLRAQSDSHRHPYSSSEYCYNVVEMLLLQPLLLRQNPAQLKTIFLQLHGDSNAADKAVDAINAFHGNNMQNGDDNDQLFDADPNEQAQTAAGNSEYSNPSGTPALHDDHDLDESLNDDFDDDMGDDENDDDHQEDDDMGDDDTLSATTTTTTTTMSSSHHGDTFSDSGITALSPDEADNVVLLTYLRSILLHNNGPNNLFEAYPLPARLQEYYFIAVASTPVDLTQTDPLQVLSAPNIPIGSDLIIPQTPLPRRGTVRFVLNGASFPTAQDIVDYNESIDEYIEQLQSYSAVREYLGNLEQIRQDCQQNVDIFPSLGSDPLAEGILDPNLVQNITPLQPALCPAIAKPSPRFAGLSQLDSSSGTGRGRGRMRGRAGILFGATRGRSGRFGPAPTTDSSRAQGLSNARGRGRGKGGRFTSATSRAPNGNFVKKQDSNRLIFLLTSPRTQTNQYTPEEQQQWLTFINHALQSSRTLNIRHSPIHNTKARLVLSQIEATLNHNQIWLRLNDIPPVLVRRPDGSEELMRFVGGEQVPHCVPLSFVVNLTMGPLRLIQPPSVAHCSFQQVRRYHDASLTPVPFLVSHPDKFDPAHSLAPPADVYTDTLYGGYLALDNSAGWVWKNSRYLYLEDILSAYRDYHIYLGQARYAADFFRLHGKLQDKFIFNSTIFRRRYTSAQIKSISGNGKILYDEYEAYVQHYNRQNTICSSPVIENPYAFHRAVVRFNDRLVATSQQQLLSNTPISIPWVSPTGQLQPWDRLMDDCSDANHVPSELHHVRDLSPICAGPNIAPPASLFEIASPGQDGFSLRIKISLSRLDNQPIRSGLQRARRRAENRRERLALLDQLNEQERQRPDPRLEYNAPIELRGESIFSDAPTWEHDESHLRHMAQYLLMNGEPLPPHIKTWVHNNPDTISWQIRQFMEHSDVLVHPDPLPPTYVLTDSGDETTDIDAYSVIVHDELNMEPLAWLPYKKADKDFSQNLALNDLALSSAGKYKTRTNHLISYQDHFNDGLELYTAIPPTQDELICAEERVQLIDLLTFGQETLDQARVVNNSATSAQKRFAVGQNTGLKTLSSSSSSLVGDHLDTMTDNDKQLTGTSVSTSVGVGLGEVDSWAVNLDQKTVWGALSLDFLHTKFADVSKLLKQLRFSRGLVHDTMIHIHSGLAPDDKIDLTTPLKAYNAYWVLQSVFVAYEAYVRSYSNYLTTLTSNAQQEDAKSRYTTNVRNSGYLLLDNVASLSAKAFNTYLLREEANSPHHAPNPESYAFAELVAKQRLITSAKQQPLLISPTIWIPLVEYFSDQEFVNRHYGDSLGLELPSYKLNTLISSVSNHALSESNEKTKKSIQRKKKETASSLQTHSTASSHYHSSRHHVDESACVRSYTLLFEFNHDELNAICRTLGLPEEYGPDHYNDPESSSPAPSSSCTPPPFHSSRFSLPARLFPNHVALKDPTVISPSINSSLPVVPPAPSHEFDASLLLTCNSPISLNDLVQLPFPCPTPPCSSTPSPAASSTMRPAKSSTNNNSASASSLVATTHPLTNTTAATTATTLKTTSLLNDIHYSSIGFAVPCLTPAYQYDTPVTPVPQLIIPAARQITTTFLHNTAFEQPIDFSLTERSPTSILNFSLPELYSTYLHAMATRNRTALYNLVEYQSSIQLIDDLFDAPSETNLLAFEVAPKSSTFGSDLVTADSLNTSPSESPPTSTRRPLFILDFGMLWHQIRVNDYNELVFHVFHEVSVQALPPEDRVMSQKTGIWSGLDITPPLLAPTIGQSIPNTTVANQHPILTPLEQSRQLALNLSQQTGVHKFDDLVHNHDVSSGRLRVHNFNGWKYTHSTHFAYAQNMLKYTAGIALDDNKTIKTPHVLRALQHRIQSDQQAHPFDYGTTQPYVSTPLYRVLNWLQPQYELTHHYDITNIISATNAYLLGVSPSISFPLTSFQPHQLHLHNAVSSSSSSSSAYILHYDDIVTSSNLYTAAPVQPLDIASSFIHPIEGQNVDIDPSRYRAAITTIATGPENDASQRTYPVIPAFPAAFFEDGYFTFQYYDFTSLSQHYHYLRQQHRIQLKQYQQQQAKINAAAAAAAAAAATSHRKVSTRRSHRLSSLEEDSDEQLMSSRSGKTRKRQLTLDTTTTAAITPPSEKDISVPPPSTTSQSAQPQAEKRRRGNGSLFAPPVVSDEHQEQHLAANANLLACLINSTQPRYLAPEILRMPAPIPGMTDAVTDTYPLYQFNSDIDLIDCNDVWIPAISTQSSHTPHATSVPRSKRHISASLAAQKELQSQGASEVVVSLNPATIASYFPRALALANGSQPKDWTPVNEFFGAGHQLLEDQSNPPTVPAIEPLPQDLLEHNYSIVSYSRISQENALLDMYSRPVQQLRDRTTDHSIQLAGESLCYPLDISHKVQKHHISVHPGKLFNRPMSNPAPIVLQDFPLARSGLLSHVTRLIRQDHHIVRDNETIVKSYFDNQYFSTFNTISTERQRRREILYSLITDADAIPPQLPSFVLPIVTLQAHHNSASQRMFTLLNKVERNTAIHREYYTYFTEHMALIQSQMLASREKIELTTRQRLAERRRAATALDAVLSNDSGLSGASSTNNKLQTSTTTTTTTTNLLQTQQMDDELSLLPPYDPQLAQLWCLQQIFPPCLPPIQKLQRIYRLNQLLTTRIEQHIQQQQQQQQEQQPQPSSTSSTEPSLVSTLVATASSASLLGPTLPLHTIHSQASDTTAKLVTTSSPSIITTDSSLQQLPSNTSGTLLKFFSPVPSISAIPATTTLTTTTTTTATTTTTTTTTMIATLPDAKTTSTFVFTWKQDFLKRLDVILSDSIPRIQTHLLAGLPLFFVRQEWVDKWARRATEVRVHAGNWLKTHYRRCSCCFKGGVTIAQTLKLHFHIVQREMNEKLNSACKHHRYRHPEQTTLAPVGAASSTDYCPVLMVDFPNRDRSSMSAASAAAKTTSFDALPVATAPPPLDETVFHVKSNALDQNVRFTCQRDFGCIYMGQNPPRNSQWLGKLHSFCSHSSDVHLQWITSLDRQRHDAYFNDPYKPLPLLFNHPSAPLASNNDRVNLMTELQIATDLAQTDLAQQRLEDDAAIRSASMSHQTSEQTTPTAISNSNNSFSSKYPASSKKGPGSLEDDDKVVDTFESDTWAQMCTFFSSLSILQTQSSKMIASASKILPPSSVVTKRQHALASSNNATTGPSQPALIPSPDTVLLFPPVSVSGRARLPTTGEMVNCTICGCAVHSDCAEISGSNYLPSLHHVTRSIATLYRIHLRNSLRVMESSVDESLSRDKIDSTSISTNTKNNESKKGSAVSHNELEMGEPDIAADHDSSSSRPDGLSNHNFVDLDDIRLYKKWLFHLMRHNFIENDEIRSSAAAVTSTKHSNSNMFADPDIIASGIKLLNSTSLYSIFADAENDVNIALHSKSLAFFHIPSLLRAWQDVLGMLQDQALYQNVFEYEKPEVRASWESSFGHILGCPCFGPRCDDPSIISRLSHHSAQDQQQQQQQPPAIDTPTTTSMTDDDQVDDNSSPPPVPDLVFDAIQCAVPPPAQTAGLHEKLLDCYHRCPWTPEQKEQILFRIKLGLSFSITEPFQCQHCSWLMHCDEREQEHAANERQNVRQHRSATIAANASSAALSTLLEDSEAELSKASLEHHIFHTVRETKCAMCFKTGGYMVPTIDKSRWAHLACVSSIPEVWYPEQVDEALPPPTQNNASTRRRGMTNAVARQLEEEKANDELSPPLTYIDGLDKAYTTRKDLICYLCQQPGGTPAQCSAGACPVAFHPWCALQAGLYNEVDDSKNLIRFSCHRHSKQAATHAIRFSPEGDLYNAAAITTAKERGGPRQRPGFHSPAVPKVTVDLQNPKVLEQYREQYPVDNPENKLAFAHMLLEQNRQRNNFAIVDPAQDKKLSKKNKQQLKATAAVASAGNSSSTSPTTTTTTTTTATNASDTAGSTTSPAPIVKPEILAPLGPFVPLPRPPSVPQPVEIVPILSPPTIHFSEAALPLSTIVHVPTLSDDPAPLDSSLPTVPPSVATTLTTTTATTTTTTSITPADLKTKSPLKQQQPMPKQPGRKSIAATNAKTSSAPTIDTTKTSVLDGAIPKTPSKRGKPATKSDHPATPITTSTTPSHRKNDDSFITPSTTTSSKDTLEITPRRGRALRVMNSLLEKQPGYTMMLPSTTNGEPQKAISAAYASALQMHERLSHEPSSSTLLSQTPKTTRVRRLIDAHLVHPGALHITHRQNHLLFCPCGASTQDDSLECSCCGLWYHPKCVGMSDSEFSALKEINVPWVCQWCLTGQFYSLEHWEIWRKYLPDATKIKNITPQQLQNEQIPQPKTYSTLSCAALRQAQSDLKLYTPRDPSVDQS